MLHVCAWNLACTDAKLFVGVAQHLTCQAMVTSRTDNMKPRYSLGLCVASLALSPHGSSQYHDDGEQQGSDVTGGVGRGVPALQEGRQ